MTPSPDQLWVAGIGIVFDDTTRGLAVACAVFDFATREDRDRDFTEKYEQVSGDGTLITPAPEGVGDSSFYWLKTFDSTALYSVYFVRENLGCVINVLAPSDFPYHEFTSELARTLASK